MPLQRRVKRHFVTSTNDGPLVTVYPTVNSVLPVPLKTAACRSLHEARALAPASPSPTKKSGDHNASNSPIIRHRGAPALVFADVGPIPSSFGTGALDDAELERREQLGVLQRRPCGFCSVVFGREHLKHRVSRKAIVEQLAAWGRTNLRPRDLTAANLYEAVSVCAFCAQFFDDDALRHRCSMEDSASANNRSVQDASSFTDKGGHSQRRGSSATPSAPAAGGGGRNRSASSVSLLSGRTSPQSFFGPVEDAVERRLHREAQEAKWMLATVMRDCGDESAAAVRHEAQRDRERLDLRERIKKHRREETLRLQKQLDKAKREQQMARTRLDGSGAVEDELASTLPSVQLVAGSGASPRGPFTPDAGAHFTAFAGESDSLSGSISTTHYLFQFQDPEHPDDLSHGGLGSSRAGMHPLDPANTNETPKKPVKEKKPLQPAKTTRTATLQMLTSKRKRELYRMKQEVDRLNHLGVPVDPQFQMQYEQLSLWCNDKTRHEFEVSAAEELVHKMRDQTQVAAASCPSSRPQSASLSRPQSAGLSRRSRPQSALAAHRAGHQAALEKHDVRQGMDRSGIDPLYAQWEASTRKTSNRFSMYKL